MEKKKVYNIYSDESCHLQNDNMPVMCLGYTKIEADSYIPLKEKIKTLRNMW